MTDDKPLLISIPEAVRELNCGRTKIYQLAHAGSLKLYKQGRRTVLRYAEVRQYADTLAPFDPEQHQKAKLALE